MLQIRNYGIQSHLKVEGNWVSEEKRQSEGLYGLPLIYTSKVLKFWAGYQNETLHVIPKKALTEYFLFTTIFAYFSPNYKY